ncbi:hypothetical protein ABZP36_013805 [Zizania latifolia]
MASKSSSQGESKGQAAAAAAAVAVASLYGRVLPSPPAVEFASPEGRRLFSEALEGGTMQGFFSLISCFQTQSEPAFCGLATLSVVLNALRIDPGRRWKGPWRWFDESMLDCCEHLDKVRSHGITFGKVACLAHCAGAEVRAFRAGQVTVHDLRRHLVRCASSQDCHLIASYHRKFLGQVHAYLKEHRSSFIDLCSGKLTCKCLVNRITWSGIEDKRLKAEFLSLVSADNLPDALKREIMHLRRQLRYLKACNGQEACEDPVP